MIFFENGFIFVKSVVYTSDLNSVQVILDCSKFSRAVSKQSRCQLPLLLRAEFTWVGLGLRLCWGGYFTSQIRFAHTIEAFRQCPNPNGVFGTGVAHSDSA